MQPASAPQLPSQMQQDMTEERAIVSQLFQDGKVVDMLLRDLASLPKNLYSLQMAYEKLIITIFLSEYRGIMSEEAREELEILRTKKSTDIESRYVIVVKKSYPLGGSVRVHLLEGGFQPRVSDGRDLFEEVMGRAYEWQIQIGEVVRGLADFDAKLHHKNQLFLDMQKVGRFQIGDTYYYQQLTEMYDSLTLMKDLTPRKQPLYVGITETHFLIFRELPERVKPTQSFGGGVGEREALIEGEASSGKLRLSVSAEMQCIDTIVLVESEGVVKLLLKKYKSIKLLYHESEEVKRQFKLAQPDIFIRGVLKYITKFQPCHIEFEPAGTQRQGGKRKNSAYQLDRNSEEEYTYVLIGESNTLEREVATAGNQAQRRQKIDLINKKYQKIIEYYSARANPYYLVYVNKLNYLYLKYFSKDIKEDMP